MFFLTYRFFEVFLMVLAKSFVFDKLFQTNYCSIIFLIFED